MEHSLTKPSEVMRTEALGCDTYRLTLMAPQIADEARPGQFVMVQAATGQDPLLRRPLSIHQVSGNGSVQILFKVVGRGTQMLAETRKGDLLSIFGPLGKGFNLSTLGENICMIGGGMGIAPLLFLGKWLVRSGFNGKLITLLGARNAAEINPLNEDFVNLGITPVIATDDGSAGHHGLVTQLMLKQMDPGEDWQILTCGPYPMMKGVVEICQGMNWRCQVSMETMMACGMGACLGCAIPKPNDLHSYQHVCKDGPVFDMSEIVWK